MRVGRCVCWNMCVHVCVCVFLCVCVSVYIFRSAQRGSTLRPLHQTRMHLRTTLILTCTFYLYCGVMVIHYSPLTHSHDTFDIRTHTPYAIQHTFHTQCSLTRQLKHSHTTQKETHSCTQDLHCWLPNRIDLLAKRSHQYARTHTQI